MKKRNLTQLRADLNNLSAQDFDAKYPGLKARSLKGLSVEELEQRVTKLVGGVIRSPTRHTPPDW